MGKIAAARIWDIIGSFLYSGRRRRHVGHLYLLRRVKTELPLQLLAGKSVILIKISAFHLVSRGVSQRVKHYLSHDAALLASSERPFAEEARKQGSSTKPTVWPQESILEIPRRRWSTNDAPFCVVTVSDHGRKSRRQQGGPETGRNQR